MLRQRQHPLTSRFIVDAGQYRYRLFPDRMAESTKATVLENGLGSSAKEVAVTSFPEQFRAVVRESETLSPWLDPRLRGAHGYEAFATEAAGRTFDDGLYRVHDDRSGPE